MAWLRRPGWLLFSQHVPFLVPEFPYDQYLRHVCRHVYRLVRRHVHRYVYRHVYRHVFGHVHRHICNPDSVSNIGTFSTHGVLVDMCVCKCAYICMEDICAISLSDAGDPYSRQLFLKYFHNLRLFIGYRQPRVALQWAQQSGASVAWTPQIYFHATITKMWHLNKREPGCRR